MGGAAHLGCGAIASEFSVSRNDVHTVLRRLQWNSQAVMVIGWHLHRHRLGPQFRVDTTNTGWGLLSGHQRGPRPGHQWGLSHGHGQAVGECDRVYIEKQSARSRADRVKLEECIRYLRDGDELVVASMDRLARSLVDLKQIVGEVTAKGASVRFVHERATYAAGAQDPRADLMLSLLGAFAEFERAIIRERQAEGIAIAKAKGKYKGRKRVLTEEQIDKALARIEAGEGPSAIARDLGVGRSTLYRALQRVRK
ncbi:recombinase family protein [Gordonia sp. NPDC057248]|uniref:recombinase family protein n=2 Tax=unclassified Gordonia (in: high G+C Gram-positive bacteria) TaxID=2657482 RepID=UPI003631B14D